MCRFGDYVICGGGVFGLGIVLIVSICVCLISSGLFRGMMFVIGGVF